MPTLLRLRDLTEEEEQEIGCLARSRTAPVRLVERARIVLASADGRSGTAIGETLQVSRPTVSRWLDRYAGDGLAGLTADKPRSGRPKQLDAGQEAAVIRKTLEEAPPDGGTHWSGRLMARAVGVHQTTIARLWRAYGLKPHRVALL